MHLARVGGNMVLRKDIRRTKIICTIGPATSAPEKIRELILTGMDVARLNFSHGDHGSHRRAIRMIREISKELGKEVGILQDLGGPKIRLGTLPVPEVKVRAGEMIRLGPPKDDDPSYLPIGYPYFMEDVSVGDRILLADGNVELRVEARHDQYLEAKVLVGGVLHSHKGVNLPASLLRVPAFTEKDRADLAVGLEEDVDFVALSFVRHERDLEPLREILQDRDQRPLLVAKIEKPQALDRLEQILDKVDCVMVARGDLGVEMPLEEVPMIQKKVIRESRRAVKPVITATQMLGSMTGNPRPTRAEAADVANAVLDGTDALMLSDETAIGVYPVEAVRVLDRIARATEPHLQERFFIHEPLSRHLPDIESSIGRSACFIAEDIQAAAIVAATHSGSTARLVARFRPSRPVLGLTPNLRTVRQLSISWGVLPALVAPFEETEEIFGLAGSWALENKIAETGDLLIVTAGVPVGAPGTTNLLKVIRTNTEPVTEMGE